MLRLQFLVLNNLTVKLLGMRPDLPGGSCGDVHLDLGPVLPELPEGFYEPYVLIFLPAALLFLINSRIVSYFLFFFLVLFLFFDFLFWFSALEASHLFLNISIQRPFGH